MRTDPFPFPSLTQYLLFSWESISHCKGGFIRNWYYWERKTGGWKIRFEIGGNRYCLNKARQHKSNHIYFIVDIKYSCFRQYCHDDECKSFVSSAFPLPLQETEPIAEYFDAEKMLFTMDGCYHYLLTNKSELHFFKHF